MRLRKCSTLELARLVLFESESSSLTGIVALTAEHFHQLMDCGRDSVTTAGAAAQLSQDAFYTPTQGTSSRKRSRFPPSHDECGAHVDDGAVDGELSMSAAYGEAGSSSVSSPVNMSPVACEQTCDPDVWFTPSTDLALWMDTQPRC